MQKKTKMALAATALVLVAAGGIARLAHAGRDGGMMGMGRHHGHMMMDMAERYDTNKDGKITQDEIDKNRADWLAEFDADKNGTLSLDEFKGLWLKARQELMVREFQEFDRDGNAQVTPDEYKSPMAQIVSNMDQNNDGALSKDDRQAMMDRHGRGRHKMGPGMNDDQDGGDER